MFLISSYFIYRFHNTHTQTHHLRFIYTFKYRHTHTQVSVKGDVSGCGVWPKVEERCLTCHSQTSRAALCLGSAAEQQNRLRSSIPQNNFLQAADSLKDTIAPGALCHIWVCVRPSIPICQLPTNHFKPVG